MGRSSAYWTANRYTDAAVEPVPTAPLTDLPAHTGGEVFGSAQRVAGAQRCHRTSPLHGPNLAVGLGVQHRQSKALLASSHEERPRCHLHTVRQRRESAGEGAQAGEQLWRVPSSKASAPVR